MARSRRNAAEYGAEHPEEEESVADKLEDLKDQAVEASRNATDALNDATEIRQISDRITMLREALNEHGIDEDLEARMQADDELLRQKMRPFDDFCRRLRFQTPEGYPPNPLDDDDLERLNDLTRRMKANVEEADFYQRIHRSAELDLVGDAVNHPQAAHGDNFPDPDQYPQLNAALYDLVERYTALRGDPDGQQQVVDEALDILQRRADDAIGEQVNRWRRATGQPDHIVNYFNRLRDPIHTYDAIQPREAVTAA